MNPTAEQIAAIQTIDRTLLVEAGAGTGKTWVLVQRFLYLLEQHPDWAVDGIFAITFTEKAAREMRTRIRHALEKRADQSPEDPIWQARRRDLDRLQVSTIHSLCSRILRENSIAAGLDPKFVVLDENQAGLLKEEAVERALAELIQGKPTRGEAGGRSSLELLASLKVLDLREQMAGLLQKRGTVQRMFDELPSAEDLLARWEVEISTMRAELWQEQLRESEFRRALDELPQVTIHDPLDKLTPAVISGQRGCELAFQGDFPAACEAWGQINLSGGKATSWGDKDLLGELKEDLKVVREVARDWIKTGVTQEVGEADRNSAQMLQQWKSVWKAVAAVYQRLKAERYALDFDDLELLTGQLLSQLPRPDRLQAFLDGIMHLMVDEFQDTNLAQQGIVYALAHPGDAGRLFVVGDSKQSIYRFRQAQVAVFNHTAQDIQRVTGFPAAPLSRSFRTHQQLVAVMNDLFEQVLQPLGANHQDFEARPGALQHQRPSLEQQIPVELVLLPRITPDGAPIHAEEVRILEARLLAEKILRLRSEEHLVWDKDLQSYRPFRFDDAAILFRSTTSMILYEEQFKAAGLPYLTISGRGYYDRPEIRALIALLSCLDNPADDLSLAAALRSPLFNLSDETLYILRWHLPDPDGMSFSKSETAIPFFKAMRNPPSTSQNEAVAFASKVMEELWGMVGYVQVWRLLRTALDRTGFEAALAMSDHEHVTGGRQRSNLNKFMSLARQDGSANLSSFLRALHDLRASEAREGEGLADAPESGAVQLMSIHASKGLEFPVVAVADLGRSQRRAGYPERLMHDPAFGLVCMVRDEKGDWQAPASFVWARWLNERMDLAESKRLLYVACTRAADLLILSGQTGSGGSWLETIQSALDIPADGAEEETAERNGYRLRIQRPLYSEDDATREMPEGLTSETPELYEMPGFAQPLTLPTLVYSLPIPVTQLERLLAANGEEDGDELDENPVTDLRPIVRPERSEAGHIPAHLIGRVIHRALADWTCLELPEVELARRVEIYARREGIYSADAIEVILRRCGRILKDLHASELHADICHATRRYSEIPFTLSAQPGVLHGVIDLLFEDNMGRWHLIDWKSEHVPHAQLQAHADQHTLQVAIYAEAARRILGQLPETAVCFLAVGARIWKYAETDLTGVLRQMMILNSV